MRNMTETRLQSVATEERGSASETGTCIHTRFVRSVWRKEGSLKRSRCITKSRWQKAVTTARQT